MLLGKWTKKGERNRKNHTGQTGEYILSFTPIWTDLKFLLCGMLCVSPQIPNMFLFNSFEQRLLFTPNSFAKIQIKLAFRLPNYFFYGTSSSNVNAPVEKTANNWLEMWSILNNRWYSLTRIFSLFFSYVKFLWNTFSTARESSVF